MSQALANLSVYLPVCSSHRSRNSGCNVKAMAAAGESRGNLDHLRHQPPQPKKRVGPVPPIGLWDRFPTARTVQQMMETMERVMEDPFAYSETWPSESSSNTAGGGYNSRGRTPWEIKEGEKEYKMRFDMPGMTRDDVKVWVEEKMLVVKAQKVPITKESATTQTQQVSSSTTSTGEVVEGETEWPANSYGRYSFRIALPENVQFEKITAEVKDGVLYISIPKATRSGTVLDISVQ